MMNAGTEQPQDMKQQALALLRTNRLTEAQALFSRICEQNAEDVDAWYFLSCIHGMQGNMDEAGRCCRRVIALHPDHGDAHVNMGNVLLSQGKIEDAVRHYQTALRSNPNNAGALCSLGSSLAALDRHDEAVANFQAALRLNPNLVEAYYNLGNSQMAQKKFDDAADSFRLAIRLNPGYAVAYNNLGNAHKELGDIASAMENYRIAVRLQPDFAKAYNNMAVVLKEQNLLQEAYAAAQHALRILPDFADAYISLANISIIQGRPDIGIEFLQRLLKIDPNHSEAHSCLSMMMHYRPEYSAEELFSIAREWGKRHTPQPLPRPAVSPDPQRRLRIGYVSGDFYNHPIGYFIEPVLTHHNRSQFEVYCYYNYSKHDAITARLQQAAHRWYNIAGQNDDAVIQQIKDDDIDILVDLSGHTYRNRLLVFAHKPAPVQVTWMGYFNTTGLPTMDYIVADRFVIPADGQRYFTEKIVRLPDAYLSFSPPEFSIDPSPLPVLTSGRFTFGCFNNPAKLTNAVIACWSKILHAIPQSQLYLKYHPYADDKIQQRYKIIFAEQGINSDRIILSGPSPRHELLAAYHRVDIALDPYPYTGGTTTLEALWMGVPVITLQGDSFVSRVSATILINAGLSEYVTYNEEDYVAKAVALAKDLSALGEMRGHLRAKLLNSPLCDGRRFTQSLESVYHNIWKNGHLR